MIEVTEGVYDCNFKNKKGCIYKGMYGRCYYHDKADSYLYHMGEIPVPACFISKKNKRVL